MKEKHPRVRYACILTVITAVVVTACTPTGVATETNPPLQQVPLEREVPIAEPSLSVQSTEPVIQSSTLDIYLPFINEQVNDHLQMQIAQFEEQYGDTYPGLNINPTFLEPLNLRDALITAMAAGELPEMAALDNNIVAELNLYELIHPVEETSDFWSQFLDDAVRNNTLDGRILAYPWQRYSCSPNYLNLVTFKDQSPELLEATHALSRFLISAENQNSNLQNPNLMVLPTLKNLYDESAIECPTWVKATINPMLVDQMFESARLQSELFAKSFDIQIKASQAAGLDASVLPNGSNAILQAVAAPAATDQEFYKDRQVIGYMTTINDDLSLKTMRLEGKALVQYGRLPTGSFLIACQPKSNDCLAISANGEEFQIDPESITWSELPASTPISTAAYVQGSITIQFYIGNILYTITLF